MVWRGLTMLSRSLSSSLLRRRSLRLLRRLRAFVLSNRLFQLLLDMDILQKSRMLEAMWVAFKWPLICYAIYFFLKMTIKPLWSAIVRALFK